MEVDWTISGFRILTGTLPPLTVASVWATITSLLTPQRLSYAVIVLTSHPPLSSAIHNNLIGNLVTMHTYPTRLSGAAKCLSASRTARHQASCPETDAGTQAFCSITFVSNRPGNPERQWSGTILQHGSCVRRLRTPAQHSLNGG